MKGVFKKIYKALDHKSVILSTSDISYIAYTLLYHFTTNNIERVGSSKKDIILVTMS